MQQIDDRIVRFQSTPPVWAETDSSRLKSISSGISIHSARVGGDLFVHPALHQNFISIHSARVGGDTFKIISLRTHGYFNPLRPCGRRHEEEETEGEDIYFNPLRPCGRRLTMFFNSLQYFFISIHSARVGGDTRWMIWTIHIQTFQSTPPVWAETSLSIPHCTKILFQSTPPVWAETELPLPSDFLLLISIHSARVGGDFTSPSA